MMYIFIYKFHNTRQIYKVVTVKKKKIFAISDYSKYFIESTKQLFYGAYNENKVTTNNNNIIYIHFIKHLNTIQ